MSDIETSQQEALAIVSDAPIDVDDLPSDAEASTSALPPKTAGPGRPKGKSTASTSKTKDADAVGLENFLLPKSTITKIAKSAVPLNTKLQKEVPIALTRSAVVFISYLTSLAQEQAAAAGVKTIRPDHVLDALPELDWGEADTARLRKDLKKQLKAFRANAKAKKEGKPVPGPSTTGKPRGRPPKKAAASDDMETAETTEQDAHDETEAAPEVNIQLKRNALLKKSASGDEEESSEEEDEDVNVRRIRGDVEEGEGESAIEDDIEEEEEEEEEEDDDIEDPEEEVDPNDFEEEMGQGLDGKKGNGADDDEED